MRAGQKHVPQPRPIAQIFAPDHAGGVGRAVCCFCGYEQLLPNLTWDSLLAAMRIFFAHESLIAGGEDRHRRYAQGLGQRAQKRAQAVMRLAERRSA